MVKFTCFGIQENGMPSGVILPDDVLHGGVNVFFCHITVLFISGHIRGPVQQGNIQQAVNNQAIVVFGAQLSPGLNEFAHGLVAGHQLIGRLQGCLPGGFTAGQFIGRNTGGDVQKSHIVVIHTVFDNNAFQERIHLLVAGCAEQSTVTFIFGVFVGKPNFTGPKSAGPVGIDAGGIEIVFTVCRRKVFFKGRQIVFYLCHRTFGRRHQLLGRQLRELIQLLLCNPFIHLFVSFHYHCSVVIARGFSRRLQAIVRPRPYTPCIPFVASSFPASWCRKTSPICSVSVSTV